MSILMAQKIQPPLNNPCMDGVSALVREVMPAHRVYCEPWFLGGEVFFRKRPSAVEFINDSDNRIMDFYMVVRSRPQELAFLIESTLYSDTLVRLADDIYHGRVVSDELYRAWAVWMRYQTSRQGAMSWMKETGLCLAAGDIRLRSSLSLDGYLEKGCHRWCCLIEMPFRSSTRLTARILSSIFSPQAEKSWRRWAVSFSD